MSSSVDRYPIIVARPEFSAALSGGFVRRGDPNRKVYSLLGMVLETLREPSDDDDAAASDTVGRVSHKLLGPGATVVKMCIEYDTGERSNTAGHIQAVSLAGPGELEEREFMRVVDDPACNSVSFERSGPGRPVEESGLLSLADDGDFIIARGRLSVAVDGLYERLALARRPEH